MRTFTTTHYEWFKPNKVRPRGRGSSAHSEPILVNERYEIIEGQDRFFNWKKRGQQISYIVVRGYGKEEANYYSEVG